jgi:hypothetical protein
MVQSVKPRNTDWRDLLWFRQGQGIHFFCTGPKAELGPTQLPVQCISEDCSMGIRFLEPKAHLSHHSSPSSAEVKKVRLYSPVLLLSIVFNYLNSGKVVQIFWLPQNTMTALSKVWIVFARSNTGVIVGWNPTRGMGVCIALRAGNGLEEGWSYGLCIGSRNWEKMPRSNKMDCAAFNINSNKLLLLLLSGCHRQKLALSIGLN